MDTETFMMSTAADELLEASFSTIKILDNYKDELTYLSEKLKELWKLSKRKYKSRGCVMLSSSRSFAPRSCPEITESLEKLQKIAREISEAQRKKKDLLEKLKISANSHEHVVEEILSVIAKRHKVKNQINFSSASARKLIQEMSLCEFQHILEGRVVYGVVGGGKELPLPEVIQMSTELIWKNDVTKASQSLRAAADKIDEFISALSQQFNNIVDKVIKLAQQAGEEQSASETRSGGGNEKESSQSNEESGADDTKKDKDYVPSTSNSNDTSDDDSSDNSWVLINFRSINNKKGKLKDLLMDNKDVLFITETWIKNTEDKDEVLQAMLTEEYTFFQCVRKKITEEDKGRGGGVAILFKKGKFQGHEIILSSENPKHLEYVAVQLVQADDPPVLVIAVYRPPLGNFNEFLKELQSILNKAGKCNKCILLAGDFNIQVDEENTRTKHFNYFLKTNCLKQHVKEQTHEKGHTLDLVISKGVEVSDLTVQNDDIADHFSVYFNARPNPKHNGNQLENKDENEDEAIKGLKSNEE